MGIPSLMDRGYGLQQLFCQPKNIVWGQLVTPIVVVGDDNVHGWTEHLCHDASMMTVGSPVDKHIYAFWHVLGRGLLL